MLTILSDDTQHRYSIPFIRYLIFSQSVKLSKPCRTAVHHAVDCSPPLIKLESTAHKTRVHCAVDCSLMRKILRHLLRSGIIVPAEMLWSYMTKGMCKMRNFAA